MTLKSRGYLLVDISIAVTIFSILSFGIFTFYKTYRRIDDDNKEKVEYLNYINYTDYIYSELKYNTEFKKILNLKINTDYFLNVDNLVRLQGLNLVDGNQLIEKTDIILEDYKLKKFYIVINVGNKNDEDSKNESNYNHILNIEVKVMKNEQCIYEKIIKRYKYIL